MPPLPPAWPGRLTSLDIVAGARELLAAGFEHPRIAVAGLNPHNGDGGVFGSEEIDVIGPAVSELVAEIGENISGPFPSDTIFLKAVAGEVDAVVTVPL